ncbi:glycerophosphodiester phosphodiesterase [Calidifontibacter indicus]|uniref:glycerophosphodiester phosphodiesterase n=1 Tax=Calidifontibacter indicus TaxID=419650 RepID=UPI003D7277A2
MTKPLVIAHRGSSEQHPEHTLRAYEQAVTDGADGVECDVRLSADGHLVCVHDRTLDRTSTGKGVVSQLSLEQLRAFDWGSWKGEEHTAEVLTLRALIESLAAAPRKVQLVVETKHPARQSAEIERSLARLLAEYDLLDPETAPLQVRLMSFSSLAVGRFAKLMPRLERVQLIEGVQLPRFRNSLATGVKIAGPGIAILRRDRDFVARHHAHGNQVHVWTVDSPEDIALCLALGVDAIISNRPAVVRKAVDEAVDEAAGDA